jgi:GDP-L-fucose synthase
MQQSARIFIAGHTGLLGSAIRRRLEGSGYRNLLLPTRLDLDLGNHRDVAEFFAAQRPEYVFLAAGKVGGILANSSFPADFLRENLAIALHVIHQAFCVGVKRLLFLGSNCAYPALAPQPMKESHLLTGPLNPDNRAYGIAKIAAIEMCRSYNLQHGAKFLAIMPSNAYGPNDNYHPEYSHVLPAFLRRMHEARQAGLSDVGLWGTGTPRRAFIYSEDFAEACALLMNLPDAEFAALTGRDVPLVNAGSGEELSLRELAERVAEVVGFRGRLRWDASRPDGTQRKLMDISRLQALGWHAHTPLVTGLRKTYEDFCRNQARSDPR